MFSKRLVGRLAVLSAPAGATCIVPAQAAMADQLQETTQMESRLSDKARHDIALNAVDGTSNTVVSADLWRPLERRAERDRSLEPLELPMNTAPSLRVVSPSSEASASLLF